MSHSFDYLHNERALLDSIATRHELLHAYDVQRPSSVVSRASHLRHELDPNTIQAALRANDRQLIQRAKQARDQRGRIDEAAARWQIAFGDSVNDLLTDANHELRRRTRALTTELEKLIDDSDPAENGALLEALLQQGLAEALDQNNDFITAGARSVCVQLSHRFEGLLVHLPTLEPTRLTGAPTQEPELTTAEAPSRRAALFTGLRGSYGGIALCGTAIGMLGPALGTVAAAVFMPLTLIAGLLFGRKVAKDEQARQLAARRASAKQSVRRCIEDVLFHETKHRRDALRRWSRQVREYSVSAVRAVRRWTAEVEELTASHIASYREQAEAWWEVVQMDLRELDRIRALAAPTRVGINAMSDHATTETVILSELVVERFRAQRSR